MNLLVALESHAAKTPEKLALAFFEQLTEPSSELSSLSYQAFVNKAHTFAACLKELGAKPGERALIILPQSLDYLVAFYGCLYAELIVVSLYAPSRPHHFQRIHTVVNDAKARLIIADKATLATISNTALDLNAIQFIDIAEALSQFSATANFPVPNLAADTTAYLQYTSGSTGHPKGVMVNYANLAANLTAFQQAIDITPTTSIVSWLPFSHDMGLIGAPLLSLYWGASAYLTSPLRFIRQPKIWLSAMTQFKGNVSLAPNFAYDLCVSAIPEAERYDLDLSSWQIAINASEPIRARTLDAFVSIYKHYGFNPKALKNYYGLAEATLVVTATHSEDDNQIEIIDAQMLQTTQKAQLAVATTLLPATYISSGHNCLNSEVLIVDPATHQPLKPRSVGEIWVKGPHVCAGYWEKPAVNQAIFAAFTSDNNGPCLRTGDLGYVNEQGALFIIGRLKDVIIIRGKNFSAADLEQTVEASSPDIPENFSAAFAIDKDEQEQLIIAIEVRAPITAKQAAQAIAHAQNSLRLEHGISAAEIFFVERNGLPRTTSGKLQRQLCKTRYLANQLPRTEWK